MIGHRGECWLAGSARSQPSEAPSFNELGSTSFKRSSWVDPHLHAARSRCAVSGMSADRMACELLKMATDVHVADSIKLAAIRDALDRAGLAAKTAVEVEVGPPKPYGVILERIEAGSRAEYRRSIGRRDDGSPRR